MATNMLEADFARQWGTAPTSPKPILWGTWKEPGDTPQTKPDQTAQYASLGMHTWGDHVAHTHARPCVSLLTIEIDRIPIAQAATRWRPQLDSRRTGPDRGFRTTKVDRRCVCKDAKLCRHQS